MNNSSSIILRLFLTALQICGNATGTVVLLGIADLMEFVDGKPTNNVIGQKLTVVCPDNMYEKLTVKVKGGKPAITSEQLQQRGGQAKIVLKNLTGKFYRTNSGEYALSCSADGWEVSV